MARSLLVFLLLTSCVSLPKSETPAPDSGGPHRQETRFSLFVLGVTQDGGLPHVGCNKSCCVLARKKGIERYPVSLGIFDRQTGKRLMIEASPKVEAQIALLHQKMAVPQRSRKPLDGLFLTHAHIGHYLGLAQFGREVASTKNLPTYVGPRMANFLRTNGPWDQLIKLHQLKLHVLKAEKAVEILPGLRILPILVPHRDEYSETFAFKIMGPHRTVLFVPDVDRWDRHRGLLDHLLEGVDVAYLDGTFYDGREVPGRNLEEIPHPPMILSMDLLQERAKKRPGSIRFIHLNHSNPLFQDSSLVEALESRGYALAKRGERVDL